MKRTLVYFLNSIRKVECEYVILEELQKAFDEKKEYVNAVDYNGNKINKVIYLDDIQDMVCYN